MAPKTKSNTKKAKAARYAKLTAEERAAKTLEFKNQGNAAFQAGDFQAAVAGFGEAILVDPTNHILYSNRSAAYLSMGRADKALEDGRKCTELKPNFSKGFARLGAAHYFQDNFEQAVQSYLLGHQLEPENEQIINGLTQAQAAQRVQTMEETEGAMDEATRKLKRVEVEAAIRKQREEDARKARGVAECIGIDLGTTYSCVGVWKDNNVEIIANSEGNRTTPSYVSFSGEERLIGDAAKSQAVTNPANTVFDAKRIIGRSFKDESVKKDAVIFPFKLIEGTDEKPMIEVEYCGENRQFAAEEISAMVLVRMKETAEAYLGETIGQAVVTVPAYFNDQQRQATKDAGKIAGLDVKRVINEPTAAALAYGLNKSREEGTVAVYDLGGGTFDVSILTLSQGVFEVLATNGDTSLGGEDWDHALLKHLISEFKKDQGIDLGKDLLALQRLKEAAEKCKKELDGLADTEINLPFITADQSGPKHLNIKVSRAQFEKLTKDLLKRATKPVEQCMKDADQSKSDIDEVILVGGMTRTPMVQEAVKNYFGKDPSKSVNPDEVVASGAAIQGGVLTGQVKDVLLIDVTPLSLGIETLGGVFTRLINKNTAIPTKKTEVFSTAVDNQTQVGIKVFQGEREMAADNKMLGSFDLVGIPPARRGKPQIEVTFDIDANGIVQVSAKDKGTGKEQKIQIQTSGGLSKDDIARMQDEAERFAEEDKKKREAAEILNNIDTGIWSAEQQLNEHKDNITAELRNEIQDKINEVKAAKDSNDPDQMKSKNDELQKVLMKIGEQIYNQQQSSSSSDNSGESVDGEGEKKEE